MGFLKVCPDCGCNLDPGEKCDCMSEAEIKEKAVFTPVKMGARGQYRLDFDRLERGYREKAVI